MRILIPYLCIRAQRAPKRLFSFCSEGEAGREAATAVRDSCVGWGLDSDLCFPLKPRASGVSGASGPPSL